jgi:hypothetical protein
MTTVIINGNIRRIIDGCEVDIPFWIDGETGNYFQWGHPTLTLAQNVDLLAAISNAVREAE